MASARSCAHKNSSAFLLSTNTWDIEKRFACEGVGVGKGARVTGQFKGASLKTPMMTHHLRRKAARKNFFHRKLPP